MSKPIVPRTLTIAGSDSGGGAGIQADLKTFSALGCFGTSALTAITAQNTRGVTAVEVLPPAFVRAQIDAVVEDIGADAAKTGMLATAPIVDAVAAAVEAHGLARLVVDPVMVATSGDKLLTDDAIAAVRDRLVPLALVVTPNSPELAALTGLPVASEDERLVAAQHLLAAGPTWVVAKGGHAEGAAAVDLLVGRDGTVERLEAPRIATTSTHGTGCTFAAAIAAYLARGEDVVAAVREAKTYLTDALRHAFPVGGGHGPVHHFHRWWR